MVVHIVTISKAYTSSSSRDVAILSLVPVISKMTSVTFDL